jgi:hypothetical protein
MNRNIVGQTPAEVDSVSGHRGPIKIKARKGAPGGAFAIVMVPIAAAPPSFESAKLAGAAAPA